ncbi:hypothetical protein GQX74_005767 [Glossina fuscipes]|nr:hypothetical protein GQX74_005767 [Glossina fuscipes]
MFEVESSTDENSHGTQTRLSTLLMLSVLVNSDIHSLPTEHIILCWSMVILSWLDFNIFAAKTKGNINAK